MALALIILAAGSVAAGYIGVPHALGGHNALHEWLSPVFETAIAHAPAEAAHAPVEAHDETSLELTLMGVSSAIAIIGIGIAAFFWLRKSGAAAVDGIAVRFSGLHRLLLNKYYVDEVYDAAVVTPIRVVSEEGLWRRVDVRLIDGAVNGAGVIVNTAAWTLRRLQTGSVRAYAGSVFVGVILVLGYYLWR